MNSSTRAGTATHVCDDEVRITDFYVNNIDPEIDAEQKGTISKAYLGKSKDCLDLIDVSVELNATVNSFGPFIVYSGVPLLGERERAPH